MSSCSFKYPIPENTPDEVRSELIRYWVSFVAMLGRGSVKVLPGQLDAYIEARNCIQLVDLVGDLLLETYEITRTGTWDFREQVLDDIECNGECGHDNVVSAMMMYRMRIEGIY